MGEILGGAGARGADTPRLECVGDRVVESCELARARSGRAVRGEEVAPKISLVVGTTLGDAVEHDALVV